MALAALAKRGHHGRVIFGGIVAGCLVFASLSQIGSVALSATGLACGSITGRIHMTKQPVAPVKIA